MTTPPDFTVGERVIDVLSDGFPGTGMIVGLHAQSMVTGGWLYDVTYYEAKDLVGLDMPLPHTCRVVASRLKKEVVPSTETLRDKVRHTVVKSNLLDYAWEWEELTDALMPVIEDHLVARMGDIYRDKDGKPFGDSQSYEDVEQLLAAVGEEDRQRGL